MKLGARRPLRLGVPRAFLFLVGLRVAHNSQPTSGSRSRRCSRTDKDRLRIRLLFYQAGERADVTFGDIGDLLVVFWSVSVEVKVVAVGRTASDEVDQNRDIRFLDKA